MAIKSKLTGTGMAAGLAVNVTGTVANTLTATGNSQGTALLMSMDDVQVFTTVASSTGCIFSASGYSAGDEITIANHGANTLSVYPATGGKIANGSANAAFSVSATKTAFFTSIDGTNWLGNVSA